MPDFELTTPKVRTDQKLAAELRPRKVESWLGQLPADRRTRLRQMTKALAAQNRVTLPPALRMQLMELYRAPFADIYDSHQSDLDAIARVPLHPHYTARQSDMLDLLSALGAGCRIAVLDLAAQRHGQARRHDLALAVQRAMYYLGQAILINSELYARPPGGSWRDLHQLYRCVEAENLQDLEVPSLTDGQAPPDALGTYLPTVLLGACHPPGLLPREARRLHELAPQWRSVMRLGEVLDHSPGPGHFRIDLRVDSPPLPMSKASKPADADTRVLRTLGVARAMHESLKNMSGPGVQKALRNVLRAGAESIDVEMFRRAGRVLGEVNIKRVTTRLDSHQELDLCVGFESVYRACGVGAGPGSADSSPESVEAARAGGEPAEQFVDLSEPMLGVPVSSDAADAGAPACRAAVVNQSASGACLALPLASALESRARVKTGDLVAGRFSAEAGWQPGTVRWMRTGSKEIRFGIRFLGPRAVTVSAVALAPGAPTRRDEPRADVLKAIWLPENAALEQPHSIILARAAGPPPARLAVIGTAAEPKRSPGRIELLARLDRTGEYEHYRVSVDGSDSDSAA